MFFNQNIVVIIVVLLISNAVGICVQDYEYGIHVLTAHCEFHSLIFLFISETEEAFFNKTTENVLSCQ
jgi:hypothetical protein